jgi:galactose oxidase
MLASNLAVSSRGHSCLLVCAVLFWLGAAPPSAVAQAKLKGKWDKLMRWPNVCVHVHLLPNGKVLWWGRRDWGADAPLPHPQGGNSLNFPTTTLYLWDPATPGTPPTALPARPAYNLFCSGHAFLPDGRLLVAGGHIVDGRGRKESGVFDYRDNSWTQSENMNDGRWYPSLLTLPSGKVLTVAGTNYSGSGSGFNEVAQIWHEGHWQSFVSLLKLPWYPWLHTAPGGRAFVAGPNVDTWYANPTHGGRWDLGAPSPNEQREYGTSVMYLPGKIMVAGGGRPLNLVQTIDLLSSAPQWQDRTAMHYPRRHHTATILADGTVLVTGGTSGHGGFDGFNDFSQPVKEPELWDPSTGTWTLMAPEEESRLYHSTALLLPDARVLSAGSGEWAYRDDDNFNFQEARPESHRTAQIFSPPYLFKADSTSAARPLIISAPAEITYGQEFVVGTSDASKITKVTWIRLGSVTHAFNQGQQFHPILFVNDLGTLKATAPRSPEICPPGYYMMFLIDNQGIPSVASIIRIAEWK